MWDGLHREVLAAVRREVFLPLMGEIMPEPRARRILTLNSGPLAAAAHESAIETLRDAIRSGQVQYVNGHFEGSFSAAISRALRNQGATFDGHRSWWTLRYADLDQALRMEVATSQSRFRQMAERANRTLQAAAPERVRGLVDLNKFIDQAIFKMDAQFRKNVAKISIAPELTDSMLEHIRAEYTRSRKLDIQDFARDEIKQLRGLVERNTFEYGLRRETLVADIERRYGVTAAKAKTLARQEVSLAVAAYQEKRYVDAGLKKYQWRCVNNPPAPRGQKQPLHAVRPDHWDLNGQVFSWSSPPIVDKRTGRRAHPKQDYNCRCAAIPIAD